MNRVSVLVKDAASPCRHTHRAACFARVARLWALCSLGVLLLVGAGGLSAADQASSGGAVIEDREPSANPLSLSIGTPSSTTQAVSRPEAPSVAGCVVRVLPYDNSTSGSERAPNANFLFGRAVYLITAAEASANGLTSGVSPGSIGWHYVAAPGAAATGSLVVYLLNTSDATNIKSADWATAISGMTVVHNASTTLPDTTAPFDIPLVGGSSFTYTGGGLYVAFDWQWAGPATTSAVVACNSALTNGLKGEQSNVSPPAIVAANTFRPETRLTPAVATVFNDASVDYVIDARVVENQIGRAHV